MPQMNKGGKFIFGKSLIRPDGSLRIPPQAADEYRIASEGRVYLFTGSRSTGGFCVTRHGLRAPSKLGGILRDLPGLDAYEQPEGTFAPYKGRSYGWLPIQPDGSIRLHEAALAYLNLKPGMALLCIRSSDIAFTLGAKGPLLEKAQAFPGVIETF